MPEDVYSVMLDGGLDVAKLDKDGKFKFFNVLPGMEKCVTTPLSACRPVCSAGVHRVEVDSHKLVYAHYIVKVPTKGKKLGIHEYQYPGAPKTVMHGKQSTSIEVRPVAKPQYELPKPGFNMLGLVSNPTVLIMLVMGGFAMCMPAMMKNMDPEAMEEMRKQQESMAGGPASLLTGGGGPQDMGSLLGMLTGEQPQGGANADQAAPEADPYDFAAGKAGAARIGSGGNAAPKLKAPGRGKRSK